MAVHVPELENHGREDATRLRPVHWRLVVTVCVAVFLLIGPSFSRADMVSPEKISNGINIFDTVVKYPSPSWFDQPVDEKEVLNISEYFRKQNGPSFVFEQIPKGEKFESWSKMLAVAGLQSNSMTMDTLFNQSAGVYFSVCGKDNFKLQFVEKNEARVTFIIFCEDSPNSRMAGYGSGIGEITIMHLSKPFGTWIKIYQHWRGKAFLANDQSTWPVDVSKLNMMIQRFKKIEYGKSVMK